ncbi:MAG: CxxxxCH/CxxCH domain-containing protein, partial [Deltaproteobacteria bacterium]|nr:CxxxxCH/CxxCH domain-containing protein [Deltaproteobacteria bacterium]
SEVPEEADAPHMNGHPDFYVDGSIIQEYDALCRQCHQNIPVAWREPRDFGCTDCHKPSEPVPHDFTDPADCSLCHDETMVNRALHGDGAVERKSDEEICETCHAGPRDGPPENHTEFLTTTMRASLEEFYNDCSNCHDIPEHPFKVEGETHRNGEPSFHGDQCVACHEQPPETHERFPVTAETLEDCSDCHTTPTKPIRESESDTHMNGSATLIAGACFTCHEGMATGPLTSHGRFETSFVTPAILSECSNCHIGPALSSLGEAPHMDGSPTLTGNACNTCHDGIAEGPLVSHSRFESATVTAETLSDCSNCHEVPTLTSLSSLPHMNGTPTLIAGACFTCHEGMESGPLTSHEAFTSATVSLETLGNCSNCHEVPELTTLGDAPHMDSTPTFIAGACATCHPGIGAEPMASHVAFLPPSVLASVGENLAECSNCHTVPTTETIPVAPHLNHSPTFGSDYCRACHDQPPNEDHLSCLEAPEVIFKVTSCANCHEVSFSPLRRSDSDTHMDGFPTFKRDASEELLCENCHEDYPDVSMIGSHAKHLNPTFTDPLDCTECHNELPSIKTEEKQNQFLQHLCDLPDEIPFNNLAKTNLHGEPLSPQFIHGDATSPDTCANIYCHGAGLLEGQIKDPLTWGGGESFADDCTDCHSFPPATTVWHQLGGDDCSRCHPQTIIEGDPAASFEHINGIVNQGF